MEDLMHELSYQEIVILAATLVGILAVWGGLLWLLGDEPGMKEPE